MSDMHHIQPYSSAYKIQPQRLRELMNCHFHVHRTEQELIFLSRRTHMVASCYVHIFQLIQSVLWYNYCNLHMYSLFTFLLMLQKSGCIHVFLTKITQLITQFSFQNCQVQPFYGCSSWQPVHLNHASSMQGAL